MVFVRHPGILVLASVVQGAQFEWGGAGAL